MAKPPATTLEDAVEFLEASGQQGELRGSNIEKAVAHFDDLFRSSEKTSACIKTLGTDPYAIRTKLVRMSEQGERNVRFSEDDANAGYHDFTFIVKIIDAQYAAAYGQIVKARNEGRLPEEDPRVAAVLKRHESFLTDPQYSTSTFAKAPQSAAPSTPAASAPTKKAPAAAAPEAPAPTPNEFIEWMNPVTGEMLVFVRDPMGGPPKQLSPAEVEQYRAARGLPTDTAPAEEAEAQAEEPPIVVAAAAAASSNPPPIPPSGATRRNRAQKPQAKSQAKPQAAPAAPAPDPAASSTLRNSENNRPKSDEPDLATWFAAAGALGVFAYGDQFGPVMMMGGILASSPIIGGNINLYATPTAELDTATRGMGKIEIGGAGELTVTHNMSLSQAYLCCAHAAERGWKAIELTSNNMPEADKAMLFIALQSYGIREVAMAYASSAIDYDPSSDSFSHMEGRPDLHEKMYESKDLMDAFSPPDGIWHPEKCATIKASPELIAFCARYDVKPDAETNSFLGDEIAWVAEAHKHQELGLLNQKTGAQPQPVMDPAPAEDEAPPAPVPSERGGRVRRALASLIHWGGNMGGGGPTAPTPPTSSPTSSPTPSGPTRA